MKGLLILTEIRSGSSWLCSLTNGTGVLGRAHEHLRVAADNPSNDGASVHDRILDEAGTANGVFAVKIFPYQLKRFRKRFGYDFIDRCRRDHDITILLLDRKDRLGQAISGLKALQTNVWTRKSDDAGARDFKDAAEEYDFKELARLVEYLSESMAFWRSYLAMRNLPFIHVFYEDLLDDSETYVDLIHERLGIKRGAGKIPASKLRIQRDNITEEWKARFRTEYEALAEAGMAERGQVLQRTTRNFVNLALKKPIRISKKRDFMADKSRKKP